MLPPLLVAAFLLAHGLMHASFVSPRPPATAGGPQWPLDLAHSWALTPLGIDESGTRAIGLALLAIIVGGFGIAALATVGIAPSSAFVGGIVAGAGGSVAMLALFFHPWLVLGVVIDVALLWATLVAAWRPGQTGLP